jgi:nitronate monooxygenase
MARASTDFSRRLGLRVPIIQAPMAGGPSSQELVAACAAAGALGSFGFAYTQPEDMKRQVAWVRERTQGPIGINLFVAPLPPAVPHEAQQAVISRLAAWYAEAGMPAPAPADPPYAPDLDGQLAAVGEIKPAVFTVHLADIPVDKVAKLKSAGIVVGGSATSIGEARRLESLGFDFVIAQGGEAGGHRGTWSRDPQDAMTGTMALTRAIVRSIKLPVVAAGGIMDGEGIAAVLALGAQAAQLGTAFLPCPECGAPEVHKQAILAAREDETRITEKFSGKPARGIANRFMREAAEIPQIAFPAQNALTGKLRQASAKAGKPDFYALWAGQGVAMARALPAAELVGKLEHETIAALRRAAALVDGKEA